MVRVLRFAAPWIAAAAIAASAAADERSEAFVEDNANAVLKALNDPELDAVARSEAFVGYMDEFANIPRISSFVLGRYARRFSDEDKARFQEAFRDFSLAAYRAQFDDLRGGALVVDGSRDRNDRDSVVESRVIAPDGEETEVYWRVLDRNGGFKIYDVALNLDGNVLWLAIEQRAQFVALLDRTNGSMDALIETLEERRAELEAGAADAQAG